MKQGNTASRQPSHQRCVTQTLNSQQKRQRSSIWCFWALRSSHQQCPRCDCVHQPNVPTLTADDLDHYNTRAKWAGAGELFPAANWPGNKELFSSFSLLLNSSGVSKNIYTADAIRIAYVRTRCQLWRPAAADRSFSPPFSSFVLQVPTKQAVHLRRTLQWSAPPRNCLTQLPRPMR